jgi:hypothetical protein
MGHQPGIEVDVGAMSCEDNEFLRAGEVGVGSLDVGRTSEQPGCGPRRVGGPRKGSRSVHRPRNTSSAIPWLVISGSGPASASRIGLS